MYTSLFVGSVRCVSEPGRGLLTRALCDVVSLALGCDLGLAMPINVVLVLYSEQFGERSDVYLLFLPRQLPRRLDSG